MQERYRADVNHASEKRVPRHEARLFGPIVGSVFGQDYFARVARRNYRQKIFGAVELSAIELARAKVHPRRIEAKAGVYVERHYEIALAAVQLAVFDCRAGREYAADRTLHEFARARKFVLLADRNLSSRRENVGQVLFGGVVWNARHGVVLPLCERYSQYARAFHGIVIEHFIEVAQAEHEQGVVGKRIARFPVLLHHGRHFFLFSH